MVCTKEGSKDTYIKVKEDRPSLLPTLGRDDDFREGEDIILQAPQPHIDTDSNEDVEDESEVDLGSEDEGDMPLAPPLLYNLKPLPVPWQTPLQMKIILPLN